MPKYNESRVTDTTDHTHYEYAHRVELNNPLGGAPQAMIETLQAEVAALKGA